MAYSVMIWLVNPGEQAYEADEVAISTERREHAPGAATGVNISPAFTRMLYGLYEGQEQAEQALEDISSTLQQNAPLRVTSSPEHANRVFLIPANRVHYVVCDEVSRPKDE
ncbi:MAG TPA: hypothetical protein VE288_06615 [Rubrobacteraceae bacterium]|nr:hypothetical protein [Rubrobacteraceae bacterium]